VATAVLAAGDVALPAASTKKKKAANATPPDAVDNASPPMNTAHPTSADDGFALPVALRFKKQKTTNWLDPSELSTSSSDSADDEGISCHSSGKGGLWMATAGGKPDATPVRLFRMAPVGGKPHSWGVEAMQVAAALGTILERMFCRAPAVGKPIRQGVDATQVAAALGTQEYRTNYGEALDYGDSDDSEEEHDDQVKDDNDEESGDNLSPVDIDDDDYVDIDSESEDEMRSSFPKDKSGKTLYAEGPQKRDTSRMTSNEKKEIEKEDQRPEDPQEVDRCSAAYAYQESPKWGTSRGTHGLLW
jgi:hypothetical protein